MEQVLLLNATFEPLKVIDWKRAIRLLTLEKVEVLEEYDREIHSVTFAIKLPAVLRLLRYIKYRKKDIKFSRANIYARDNFHCQYCGHGFESQDLTFDHVIPQKIWGQNRVGQYRHVLLQVQPGKGGQEPERSGLETSEETGKA